MNKLTTINTIKKAAPLALLAVVMSGSAFAGGPGENKGKKQDRTTGAKASINVNTTCHLAPYPANELTVTTEITDSDSEDFGSSFIKSATAQAQAKDKGKMYDPIGPVETLSADLYLPNTFTSTFDVCEEVRDSDDNLVTRGLSPNDTVVSALSTVVIFDGEFDVTYTSQCENIWSDVNEDGVDDDGFDQSAWDIGVDADQTYIYCSEWDGQ